MRVGSDDQSGSHTRLFTSALSPAFVTGSSACSATP